MGSAKADFDWLRGRTGYHALGIEDVLPCSGEYNSMANHVSFDEFEELAHDANSAAG